LYVSRAQVSGQIRKPWLEKEENHTYNISTERLKERKSKQWKKSKNARDTGKEECEAKFSLFSPGAYSKITSRAV